MNKEIIISEDRNETRAAILESRQVTQLYFERRNKKSLVGNIYVGKVKNVLPGLDAAFVDIGEDKNAFLYVNEIGFDTENYDGEEIPKKIQHILKPGQMILVQVTKDAMKTKGARITTFVSIPGRYLVLAPFNKGVGVSKKLSFREKDNLRKTVEEIKGSNDYGLIVRTAAREANKDLLKKDLKQLKKKWSYIKKKVTFFKKPGLISSEYSLIIKLMRDVFSEEFSAIYVDKKNIKREIGRYLRSVGLKFNKIIVHHGKEDLFESFNINEVIENALESKVWLKSGGFIVIDHGEAMTTVDVNTGKYTSSKSSAHTILRTNLEAAEAIVSQLRLRDIGGIIVIDFIDMASEKDRKKVYSKFMRCLENDSTKTEVLPFSKLGLLEMTRKNVSDGILGTMCRTCPSCMGSGFVKSEETIRLEIERKIRKLARESRSKGFLIKLKSSIAAQIIGSDGRNLKHLERTTKKYINIQGDSKLPLDAFILVAEGSVKQVKEAAQPFRIGDILNLVVEEQYLHNKSDAISRVNGYVVQIIDGSKHMGKRLKVEIKSVSKTSAVAEIHE
ncbi:MAG: Rne/Rng family ribonuclease [Actinomycetota bacterium]|nr:Rne/Rng family ribonuclease [Actinomycetota bacterium]